MHRVVPLFVLDHEGHRQFADEHTNANRIVPFDKVVRI